MLVIYLICKEGKVINSKIVDIYKNMYNTEIEWKHNLDNKFASRLSLFIVAVTADVTFFTNAFFTNTEEIKGLSNIVVIILKIVSVFNIILLITLLVSFYRCFFRLKLNYNVLPTTASRIFHFYINKNNMLDTKEEDDFFDLLVDSYLYCAYSNSVINEKRGKALIVFDNVLTTHYILIVVEYVVMLYKGYSIQWVL